jgi:hypothetical protein
VTPPTTAAPTNTDLVIEPLTPVTEPNQQATPAAVSTPQGRQATIDLDPDCPGATAGKLVTTTGQRPTPLVDTDLDASTFSFATGELDLGRYRLIVDCGQDTSVSPEIMIFRQNGAERGGANSIVLVTSVGFGSTVALFGLPALIAPIQAPIRGRGRARTGTNGSADPTDLP